MAAIKAEHLNPFLLSAKQVLQQVCNVDVTFGPITKDDFYVSGEPLFIMLGVTGEITGQVCMVLGTETAKDVASRMMMGNAATLLSNNNIMIDITPPTLLVGSAILSSPEMAVIKVPLLYNDYEIQLSFLLKTAQ